MSSRCSAELLVVALLAACGESRAPRDAPRPIDAAPSAIAPDASRAGVNVASMTVGMVQLAGEPTLYVDRTEVTVAAYRRCVEAKRCTEPELGRFCSAEQRTWGHADRDDHPVNCVTVEQAQAMCAFQGRRLPTAAEWERAAGKPYPWGDAPPTCARAILTESPDEDAPSGCGRDSTWPVGSRPDGASADGVLDLIGNVAELVTEGPSPRGGGYYDVAGEPELTPGGTSTGLAFQTGFRCVY